MAHARNADLEDEEGGNLTNTPMLGLNYYHGKHIRVMANLLKVNIREAGEDDTSRIAATICLLGTYFL